MRVIILAVTLLKVDSTVIPPEVSGCVQGLAATGHYGLHLVEDHAHTGEKLFPGLNIDTWHRDANT